MVSCLGIDPGKQGGIVHLPKSGVVHYWTMPETEYDVAQVIRELSGVVVVCYIEKVHSMPNQSAQSGFTFGMGYGGLRMALIMAEIPFQEVTPRKWQAEFSIPSRKPTENKTEFKKKLRAKAQQLFPTLEIWKCLMKDQLAVCDALLIAEYGRRHA